MLIKNVTIVTHENQFKNHWIRIVDGVIEGIGRMGEDPSDDTVYDGLHQYALPGAIDIHVHGTKGANAMDANKEFFEKMAQSLPLKGTTSYLMTTMTESLSRIKKALTNIKNYQYDGGAEMIGVHLEGPFINEKYKGAQNSEYILKPDIDLMKELTVLSQNKIKIVTYAPEFDVNHKFLNVLQSNGIIPSVGHSDATYNVLENIEEHTTLHLTHFYNGMRGLHHREAGIVGFGMHKSPFVEIICDGKHVSEEVIQLTYNIIGPNRLMIITDAMHAQDLDDGIYIFGGQEVELKNGEARLLSGSLAGSVISMSESIKNMKTFTNCSWSDIVKMTSFNQANRMKLTDRGEIAVGKRADIVLYDEDANLKDVFIKGKRIEQY